MKTWLISLLVLPGCVSSITGSTYYDGRFWYSNVKSGSDIAGGPRQDVMTVVDRDGRIVESWTTSGNGTFQTVTSGLSAAIVSAGGQVAGNAAIRPSRNTTNVSMDIAGGAAGGGTTSTSATGGSGGTSTTSSNSAGSTAASTTSSNAATSSNATGGAGGAGGAGGGTTSGGNIPPGQLNP
jgi:hypothetical protein